MNNLIKSKCERCGYEGEPLLEFSGPHIKMSCIQCRSYIKFIATISVPKLLDIRLRIWVIASENISLIETAKEKIGFPSKETLEGLGEISLQILYWQLYLATIHIVEHYGK